MELYPSLGLSELRPPENAKAKIYRSRIKGVYIAFQVDLEIVTITAFPGLVDKDKGELLEDPKASFFRWRSPGCAAKRWSRTPNDNIWDDGPPNRA